MAHMALIRFYLTCVSFEKQLDPDLWRHGLG